MRAMRILDRVTSTSAASETTEQPISIHSLAILRSDLPAASDVEYCRLLAQGNPAAFVVSVQSLENVHIRARSPQDAKWDGHAAVFRPSFVRFLIRVCC
jgi:hypothetical protein